MTIIDVAGGFLAGLLNRMILAVVVLLIGFIAGRVLGKMTHRLLHEVSLNKSLKQAGLNVSLESIVSKLVTYSIYFLAILPPPHTITNLYFFVFFKITFLNFPVINFLWYICHNLFHIPTLSLIL